MKDTKSGIICLTKIRESVDKCYEEYRTSIEIAKVQIVSIGFTFCALLKRPKALVSDSVTDSSRCLRNVLRPKSGFGTHQFDVTSLAEKGSNNPGEAKPATLHGNCED